MKTAIKILALQESLAFSTTIASLEENYECKNRRIACVGDVGTKQLCAQGQSHQNSILFARRSHYGKINKSRVRGKKKKTRVVIAFSYDCHSIKSKAVREFHSKVQEQLIYASHFSLSLSLCFDSYWVSIAISSKIKTVIRDHRPDRQEGKKALWERCF